MTPQQKIISGLLDKFSDATSKTIARMAFQQFPQVFLSIDAARNTVRRLRGAYGKNQPMNKKYIRPKQTPGDPFAALPEAKRHFDDWKALQIDGPRKVLVLSDIHIPYHDVDALRLALTYGKACGADTILLNGDIADFFSVSFWEKDPRERDLAAEIESVKTFLNVLRESFPKAEILYKLGNHEERWIRYLSVKAPELLGIPDFEFDQIFNFASLGIKLVADRVPIRLGYLNVIHGHEYRSVSSPVNPARGFFLRAKTHVLGGHLHQTSQHSEKNLEDKVVSAWSTGCLCDLHPDYAVLNQWNLGFAFVTISKNGTFEVSNMKIINGEIL